MTLDELLKRISEDRFGESETTWGAARIIETPG